MYAIRNCTIRELLLRLNSGLVLHLAAGAETTALEGAEINGNPRIASLLNRQMVIIETIDLGRTGDQSSGRETSKSSGKKTSVATADKADITEETRAGGSK